MARNVPPETPISGLAPIYATPVADEPVHLWQGRLGIRQGDYFGEGEGTLDLVWTSGPDLQFDVPSLVPVGTVEAADCVLAIRSLNAEAAAYISDAHFVCRGREASVGARGRLDRNVVIGNNANAGHVIFHVVNFWRYLNPRPANAPPEYDIGRVVFEGEGWRVTLQSVPGLRELEASLHFSSGYGITHVGKAERTDGSPISREGACELFNALHSFLSFARGIWSPPILYIGIDQNGSRVWQDWTVRHASPWKGVMTWFPTHEPQCLAKLFPGFMRVWLDADRRDILQVAIYWYVEANLALGIEGAVMFCQSGLERLTYYILVHEKKSLSEQDFRPRGLSGAERLRRLLTEFRLPTAIGPPRLRIKQLPALAVAQGWTDAADALVTLRNSIVHPDERNMQRLAKYPVGARIEALTIWLWYFELVLLKWLGFSGNYVNRQTIEFNGQTETVP